MKTLFVIATIWFWGITIMVSPPALVSSSSLIKEPKALKYNPVMLDLLSATSESYSTFITSLRNELKDPKLLVCDIPTLRKTSTDRYVQVVLKVDDASSITLAVQATNLYVRGYKNNVKKTARYLNDTDQDLEALKRFFGVEPTKTSFTGNYKSLENAAKRTPREKIQLGIESLRGAVYSVLKDKVDTPTEAKFFIITIQMVSEAARYKYIENLVKNGSPTPDGKMIDLETSWEQTSEDVFKKFEAKTCKDVALQIVTDVGILLNKAKKGKLSHFTPSFISAE